MGPVPSAVVEYLHPTPLTEECLELAPAGQRYSSTADKLLTDPVIYHCQLIFRCGHQPYYNPHELRVGILFCSQLEVSILVTTTNWTKKPFNCQIWNILLSSLGSSHYEVPGGPILVWKYLEKVIYQYLNFSLQTQVTYYRCWKCCINVSKPRRFKWMCEWELAKFHQVLLNREGLAEATLPPSNHHDNLSDPRTLMS